MDTQNFSPDYIPRDCAEVKVDISQEETGLYITKDPTEDCGGVRIYNTRPILKRKEKYKCFAQKESETYEVWNIHVCCDHEEEIPDYTYRNAKLVKNMIDSNKEYIISAAIHYSKNCGLVPFHSVYGISDGVVITGFRHPLCIQAAIPWMKKGYKEISQGFITSLGRYVSREEAAKLAYESGQVSVQLKHLFSEDIFPEQMFFGKVDENYKEK